MANYLNRDSNNELLNRQYSYGHQTGASGGLSQQDFSSGLAENLAMGVYESPGQTASLIDMAINANPVYRGLRDHIFRVNTSLQEMTDKLVNLKDVQSEYTPELYTSPELTQGAARLAGNVVGDPLEALPLGIAATRFAKGGIDDVLRARLNAERGAVGGAADDLLNLPNPKTKRAANEALREDWWARLEKSTQTAGVKRNKNGTYVGGPKWIDSPQKKTAVVNKYMRRVQDALDAGIQPGYFYREGRDTLSGVTDNPEAHRRLAEVLGPTSTQVGPHENLNYALRAVDQAEMGVPTSVGIYPNALRPRVDAGLYDEAPWTGFKVERYSTQLSSPDELARAHPLQQMPPNDQWEGFGVGFEQGHVPSGPAQVAWSDHIREQVARRINKQRAEQGLSRLTLPEIQELHWAAIRAEADGRPLRLNPKDTIQGSIPAHTMQHSWEAEPGPFSGHSRGDISAEAYADEIYNLTADEQGKDRLVRAMGGHYQQPIVKGTGVYKGDTSPGFQSRSLASHTKAWGLDDASAQRIDSTEAVRQLALAQDARATNMFRATDRLADTDTFHINTGGTPSREQSTAISKLIDDNFGGNAGFVFTDDGYRVLNVGMDNKEFTNKLDALIPQLKQIKDGEFIHGSRMGIYNEFDWAGGNATRDMLETIDKYPGSARLADSPETRALMGEYADKYDQLRAAGMQPNEKLINVLKAWKVDGLAGVRSLVQKGLAPAVAIGIFSSQMLPSQDEQVM